jgi:hypothetical protein
MGGDLGSVVAVLLILGVIATFGYLHLQASRQRTQALQTLAGERFAVWLMTLPSALPALEVRPEGVFGGRVAAALGMGDLELESEEFNRAFRVSVDDDRYGSAMMHPRMMEFLLATGQAQGASWRIMDDVLLSWERHHAEPDEVLPRLDLLGAIVGLVPSYVWKDFGPQAGPGG